MKAQAQCRNKGINRGSLTIIETGEKTTASSYTHPGLDHPEDQVTSP